MVTRLILVESASASPLARLLDTLGVTFERFSSIAEALAAPNPPAGGKTSLILSEEQLIAARTMAGARSLSLVQLFSGYAGVLIYPMCGRVDGVEALSKWIAGTVGIARLESAQNDYSVRPLALAGPFAGLQVGPANTASDFGLTITGSHYPVETIVSIDQRDFFTRIDLPTTQLFVCCSSAVFDVDAEARRNLSAAGRFSGLVPLILFLRHSGIGSWRTPVATANIVIDDPDLNPSYGFLEASTLARCVDELACAVSIAFIPWNFKRTSPEVVELFRSRWPLLSLCIHGCDHVRDEFCAGKVSTTRRLIALALDRMRRLSQRTGLEYDRVMVFPRGEFSSSGMQALRESTLIGAVNTELLDKRNGGGVSAGQLLQPAITAYSGFPLFLRRSADEPLANFALDLLLGKPCLAGMHHDYFRNGPEPFIALINSLNTLDPSLTWTNLESIVSQAYSVRPISDLATEVRLFSPWTSLAAGRFPGELRLSKYEPLADQSFRLSVDGQEAVSSREGGNLRFLGKVNPTDKTVVKIEISPRPESPLPSYSLPYRIKVGARRRLSRIRDNHETSPAWLRAIWKAVRRSEKNAVHGYEELSQSRPNGSHPMKPELSILMPCLNEARTLASCITKAHRFLDQHGIAGEVIIADNGSSDGSVELAKALNARVVSVPVPGYGAALAAGIAAAEGEYVIMGDSDESYDFSALQPFVEKLRAGHDLVMGNRFRGGIASGAMPPMHRYFGNPFLTAVGRLFFSARECGDFYCGLRGFRKEAIQKLELQSRGMEFALEMLIKAKMHGLRITEVPTTLSPDGRDRAPHLRRYSDGWRSLRFYLLMAPRWFFGIPGLALLIIGVTTSAFLLTGPVRVMSVTFDYHTLLYSTAAILLGYQSILLFIFAKLMAVETGLHPLQTKFWFLEERKTLERCSIAGVLLLIVGIALGILAASQWESVGFGTLQPAVTIRLVICSVLFLLLGGQTVLAGFYFGLVNLVAERRALRQTSFAEAAREAKDNLEEAQAHE